MSTACMKLTAIQPAGPYMADPTNVLTRYLLDHPMLTVATLSHPDTAAIAYLSPTHKFELLSVPAQAVPPSLGG